MRLALFFGSMTMLFVGVAQVSAEDLRREVNTIDAFCTLWNDTCIKIAHRAGRAYTECSQGYEGNGTATTNCYVVVDNKVTDYNAEIVSAIKATYAS